MAHMQLSMVMRLQTTKVLHISVKIKFGGLLLQHMMNMVNEMTHCWANQSGSCGYHHTCFVSMSSTSGFSLQKTIKLATDNFVAI